MKNSRPLRVCLDARLISGKHGGIEQVIIGLASGLSKLSDGDEQYSFLAYANHTEWLKPYLSGSCRILAAPATSLLDAKSRLLTAAPWLRTIWRKANNVFGLRRPVVPRSDGTVERTEMDLVHFTTQRGFLTSLPSLYQPHDLQHVHLPEFYTAAEREYRNRTYRALCDQATAVVVGCSWVKRDIAQHFGLPADKICVVPWAPLLDVYPEPTVQDLTATSRKYELPDDFLFYPAQTWPHKNHMALLEALSILRSRSGRRLALVCSGTNTEYTSSLLRKAEQLEIGSAVKFLGFVSAVELHCLYRLCRCVVIPTLFEAASFPIWEAFQAGAPACCSNVTSLPEQSAGAALIFDPRNPVSIADAIAKLCEDKTLRRELVQKGRDRVSIFTWHKTAKLLRAHYRRLAARPLPEEDQQLLAAPPLF